MGEIDRVAFAHEDEECGMLAQLAKLPYLFDRSQLNAAGKQLVDHHPDGVRSLGALRNFRFLGWHYLLLTASQKLLRILHNGVDIKRNVSIDLTTEGSFPAIPGNSQL